MKAFDATEYRRTVLAKLKDDHSLADPATGDVMWVCAVEPGASPAEALKRLDDVAAQWQKDRNHPKYKGICAELVKHRAAYAEVLKNPEARQQASARHEEEQAARSAEALKALDSLAAELRRTYKGIPADRVPALRSVAEQDGLDADGFARWLSGQSVLGEERGVGAVPWEAMVRKQVRETLTKLANVDPAAAPRTSTLFTFLGVPPNATVPQVRSAHARLSEANLRRQRDAVMTLTNELLAHVSKRMFSEDGLESYTASLHADAREHIKDPLRRYAIVTGSVNASQFQALVMTVVGLQWGITHTSAKDIVTDAAHQLSVPVEVAADTTVVVCGACGRPQSPGRKRNCQYCNKPLYRDCPQCSAKVESATQICPQCGCDIALHERAALAIEASRGVLSTGRPLTAQQMCLHALAGADVATAPPALRAVITEADTLIEQAHTHWRELRTEWDRSRVWQADQLATWLVRNAADVPEPGTDTAAAAVQQQLAAAKETVEAAVRAAAQLPAERAEAELLTLDVKYPDAPPVQAALNRLPLAPPRDVLAVLDGTSIDLSWVAAPTRGVSYRVERHVVFPEDKRTSHVVGTTSATSLEDAGVPVGVGVRYTVTAVAGARTSPAASSPEPGLFLDGDIEAVHAEVVDGNVVITWPAAQLSAVKVVAEREVDASAGIKAPVRRLIPHEPGRLVDDGADTGVPYRYRVSLRYATLDGTVTNTTGKWVAATVVAPPAPVKELWSSGTDGAGSTTISFPTVTAGEVTIYAGGQGWPAPNTVLARAELERVVAASGARAVGSGRRRVVDPHARGQVSYHAVTVNGDLAVVGAQLSHLAIPKATGLSVVADRGHEVVVGFTLPDGVTEAFVAWRRDGEYPHSATEPARDGAGSLRVTNTKLDIDGGVAIPAPDDGRSVHVVVFSAARVGNELVPGQSGPGLVARSARPVTVQYRVSVVGLLRKKVTVNLETREGVPLPPLEVVAVSESGSRRTVETVAAGQPSIERVLAMEQFGEHTPWRVEVVSLAPPGSAVTVEAHPDGGLRVEP